MLRSTAIMFCMDLESKGIVGNVECVEGGEFTFTYIRDGRIETAPVNYVEAEAWFKARHGRFSRMAGRL